MAVLLQDRKFIDRIRRVHIDEAHNIYTSGTSLEGRPAFRPAWGTLNEFRVRCKKSTTFQALSATLPKHILSLVDEKLALSHTRQLIKLSVNRPNIVYATHTLIGGTNHFRNLNCIIPRLFHPPMRLPKLLIFHDNKTETNNASNHINSLLPEKLQGLGICRHYHSDMSAEYLEKTFADFTDPDGTTLILNGTSGAGTVSSLRY